MVINSTKELNKKTIRSGCVVWLDNWGISLIYLILKSWEKKKNNKERVFENANYCPFVNCYRCPARCKTNPNGNAVKFLNLDHNHGKNTQSKNRPNVEITQPTSTPPIKSEQNWIDYEKNFLFLLSIAKSYHYSTILLIMNFINL